MRVAVIGSRGLMVDDLGKYLPDNVTEIVSGGVRGVDSCARSYAQTHGIKLTEFLKRNITIIQNADLVLAFWDGTSHGTKFVIDNCKKIGVPVKIFVPNRECK